MGSVTHSLSILNRWFRNYFFKGPICVSFEITYKCNARCKHCHLGGPVDEERASAQIYGEICRQVKPVVAQLSGGEPLLRRDLEQILKAIRIPNRAPYIIVTTNGVLLTKKKYFQLLEGGVNRFSISLDYPDERHDNFRQIPGLFKHIEKLIESLDSENHKAINIACVLQSDNFREMVRLVELAKKWNVTISFSAYTPLRTGNKNYMLSKRELEEFKEIIKQVLDLRKRNNTIYTSEYSFRNMVTYFENGFRSDCRAGEKFLIVNPDGTLSPCGLITAHYKSGDEIIQDFTKNNTCGKCYTSIRANTEKPFWYLIKDNVYQK